MDFQEYIIKFSLVSTVFYIMSLLYNKKKNVSLELYASALRNENDGLYDAAVSEYEQALFEQERLRFKDARLIAGIHEKLKVLHTIISYNNNFQAALIKPAV